MTIRELMEELEDFADEYGDEIEVAVNRNGRAYPVYILTSGVYPAHTRRIEHSGYFSYLDDEDDLEEFDGDVPMPNLVILND